MKQLKESLNLKDSLYYQLFGESEYECEDENLISRAEDIELWNKNTLENLFKESTLVPEYINPKRR